MTSEQPYAGLLEELIARYQIPEDVPSGALINPDGPEAAEAISSLLKKVGELEVALEPFARVAALNEPLNLPDDLTPHHFLPQLWPTYGDFKRALAAIGGRKALEDKTLSNGGVS